VRRPVHLLFAALLLVLPRVGLAQDARVLMVGNSYTTSNDLPALVAAALQDTVPAYGLIHAQGHSPGGLTLADHASQADGSVGDTALRQLLVTGPDAGSWDWVFLQDQSQVPGFPQNEPMWQASAAGAETLAGLIVAGDGETVLLLTWGRRDGDAQNPTLYPDFSTMQQRLLDGYLAYAAAASDGQHTAWIAPAGLAFARVHDDLVAAGQDPTAQGSAFHALYTADGSHPALPGSYLAALTLAAALSGHPATGAGPPPGLDAKTAAALQQAATAVTVDDPFGVIALRWAFDWGTWTSPGDVAEDGTVISDPVTRPVVRVAAPTTASDGVTVAADHGGSPGSGRLWVEDPLTVQGPLTINSAGTLELRPDEPGELLVEVEGAAVLTGTIAVSLDDDLQLGEAGTWTLLQASAIDASGGHLEAPDGFTLSVETEGPSQILQLAWGAVGDDDDSAGDDDASDDDSSDDDDSGPPAEDCGSCGCRCWLSEQGSGPVGVVGPALLLALVVMRRRRR